MAMSLTASQRLLVTYLEQVAAQALPAPSNGEIALQLGFATESSSIGALQRLEQKGVIRLDRHRQQRRIIIVETGAATRFSEHAARGPALKAGPEPISAPVDRDPCPYCGVRRDIGCRHQRRNA